MSIFAERFCPDYLLRLQRAFNEGPVEAIEQLANALFAAHQRRSQVFLVGNGGSASNANHLANDFLYGLGKGMGTGVRAEALTANVSVLTCLANDLCYEEIFSEQLRIKAQAGDVLIALSGSGNSMNIVRALEAGRAIGMETFAVLGYSGGSCKAIAEVPIHFPVDDMQVAEDLQLMVGHICMQWVCHELKRSVGLPQ